jgi:alkylhydroperoxidase family enzyme
MYQSGSTIVRNRGLFRLGIACLALVQTSNGLWALLAPSSFYSDFPFGRGWVEVLPAYNEHLTRDVGGLFLATAVMLAAAAWFLERRLVAVALGAWLAFAVPHFVWHLFNLEPYTTGDAVANMLTLSGTVFVPLALLALLARDRRAPAAAPAAAPASPRPAGGNGRIAGVPERTRNPVIYFAYRDSRKRFGAVMDPVAVFAHHPKLMLGYGMLELAADRSHVVEERLKHLAEMRAGMLAGCEWCLDFGSALSAEKGVSEAELRDLPRYRTSERFPDLDKLVLHYATGISRTPVDVPDELFDRLREHFDEAQLVELTTVIALENFRARFNWAFGIASQGFSEGAYCVRPEHTAGNGLPLEAPAPPH